jgi:hypothetical protein
MMSVVVDDTHFEQQVSSILKHLQPMVLGGEINQVVVQVSAEAEALDLEEQDSLSENALDSLISNSLEDFPESDDTSPEAKFAAEIVRNSITQKTRDGHARFDLVFIFSLTIH